MKLSDIKGFHTRYGYVELPPRDPTDPLRLRIYGESEEPKETGTFVGVKFTDDTCDKLVAMMDKMGLETPTPRKDLHATVMYSLKPIPDFVKKHPDPVLFEPPKKASGVDFHIFPSQKGENVLVLRINGDFLTKRHNEIIDKYGAEYTHDEYLPHVTLMYSADDFDLSNWTITDYDTDLEIESEYNSPIDPKWK